MNVYQKLNVARSQFHQSKLKKTGQNKFAGYSYFELGDFIIPALDIFNQVGLTGIVSFGTETAELRIINNDKPEETIVISSPMSSAALKGCHEVQNLGAVQTYLRRYLWVAALEIVEHDALDATTGNSNPLGRIKPTDGVKISDDRENVIADVAAAIEERMEVNDIDGAYGEYIGITDSEEKIVLWTKLGSKTRAAIKKHGELVKGK